MYFQDDCCDYPETLAVQNIIPDIQRGVPIEPPQGDIENSFPLQN
jgi:hypothetical protein